VVEEGCRQQETGREERGIRVAERRWRRPRAQSYTQASAQDVPVVWDPWGPSGSSTDRSWYGCRRLKQRSNRSPSVHMELSTWRGERNVLDRGERERERERETERDRDRGRQRETDSE
jgi:hypothetical protein